MMLNISQTAKDTDIVAQNANRKVYQSFQMVPFPMILNDPNPNFKVTSLLKTEYLRNGARYRYYNELLIGTYAPLKRVILNDLQ